MNILQADKTNFYMAYRSTLINTDTKGNKDFWEMYTAGGEL